MYSPKLTDEQKLYCEAWRKGWSQPEGLTIPCDSRAEATKMRFALYNAVKWAKKPQALVDEALAAAIADCSITYLDGPQPGLHIRRRSLTPTLQRLAGLVGGTAALEAVDRAAADSQQAMAERLLQEVEGTLDAARTTPYYTRER